MNEIKINDEFRNLIPNLTDEEFALLEQSIITDGIREPIITWNKTIVDGHNRYEVARRHKLNCPTIEKHFESKDDVKLWMIDNQKGRRNLTDGWKYELAQVKKAILAERGRKAYEEKSVFKGNQYTGALSKIDNEAKHNTQKEIAEDLGWSTGKTAQADYVWKHGDDEIREKVKQGDVSINQAYTLLKNPEKKKEHVANNSGENEWYTPSNIIEAARRTMGSIDLDPASCEIANRTVGASTFYTKENSGLENKWFGNVWLNPPYAQPLIADFAEKTLEEVFKKSIKSACILINNATETSWFNHFIVRASAVCFIKSRVKFIDKEGKPSGAPLQGQAVIYIGDDVGKFTQEFGSIGWIATVEYVE